MPLNDPNKTIVIDVDDTIFVTVDRDYRNSQPIPAVVAKMRALKEAGWTIILYTARGQGRSGGNVNKIKDEVLAEIIYSCVEHDVPYDKIILDKPFAAYYVDDKALRPAEFVLWEHD